MNPIRAVVCGLIILVLVGLAVSPVSAHEPGTSALSVVIDGAEVEVSIDVPLDLLGLAVGTELTSDAFELSLKRSAIVDYLDEHLTLAGGGTVAEPVFGPLTVVSVDGIEWARLVLTHDIEADDAPLVMTYDAIFEVDPDHRVMVTERLAGSSEAVLAVIDRDQPSVTISSTGETGHASSTWTVMVAEGYDHVLAGADHILFLLVLLVPAPLAVSRRRWVEGPSFRRAIVRVVRVSGAFTVGHSLTLALSAFGVVDFASRPVEVLVAGSVAIAAIHAWRPLTSHGEVVIAGSFGLIHGLAFAGILDDLGIARVQSATALLGFNVGVELAQLVVIAGTFPSLWVLSRTGAYTRFRKAAATLALVASTAWAVERVGGGGNPLSAVEATVVDHQLLTVLALAIAALAALVHTALNRDDTGVAVVEASPGGH
ncbi:MAG: HupE/UreJ family protein [Acidimicrobiales bacterium]